MHRGFSPNNRKGSIRTEIITKVSNIPTKFVPHYMTIYIKLNQCISKTCFYSFGVASYYGMSEGRRGRELKLNAGIYLKKINLINILHMVPEPSVNSALRSAKSLFRKPPKF